MRNLYNVRGRTPVSIKREDAENIARLAKLQISDDQLEKITGDLSNILSLVDQLQAADTSNIEPMAHPMDAVQRLRPDQVTETNNREAFQKIAPATEEGLYLVPKVIE
nr:Asp-tRNA(Asn)/Glu-tRNA(Gln) amidotransferase subunit GatC [Alkalimarinus sediminis]